MQNKVTLIIPDIHLRHEEAEKIIASVKHDEVIFLGDYFDDFGDNPDMFTETCTWLESSVNKPNRIHLFGNHDVHYAFDFRTFRCSGYEQWKHLLIQDSVSKKVWDKLKWYHVLDGTWLLTHAGLHKANLPEDIRALYPDRQLFLAEITKYLDTEIVNGFRKAANNTGSWVFNAGRSRGGMNNVGGIIWCDYDREFFPITGLNQILGHTPQAISHARWMVLDEQTKRPVTRSATLWTPDEKRFQDTEESVNIDLDVWKNTHYATWDGKFLKVAAVKPH
jgi:hypothetical protein